MRQVIRFSLALALLLGLISTALQAQAERKIIPAKQAIVQLRDSGVLLIRLRSFARTLELKRAALDNPKLTLSQRQRQEKIIKGLERDRDAINRALMEGARTWTFCPVYFAYDTSNRALLAGERQGMLLDTASLSILPDLAIPSDKQIFVLRFQDSGQEFPTDVLRLETLYAYLASPFPYYATVRKSFAKETPHDNTLKAMKRLHKRLEAYYREHRP